MNRWGINMNTKTNPYSFVSSVVHGLICALELRAAAA